MKRKLARLLLCALLSSLMLSVAASADMGPKPQLTVRVKNAPQEPYYLDLLAEGEYDEENGYSGIEWSYHGKEDTLDAALLDALRDAVPEGWHACTAEGGSGAPMWGQLEAQFPNATGTAVHTFGYVGVPDTYRILIVTKSGETWISDVQHRQTLQSSTTVTWNGESSTSAVPPAAAAYAMQFLSTFLPTLVLEGVILLLFGFSWKKNRKTFLLVNLATQGALMLFCSVIAVGNGVSWGYYFFLLLPGELIITLTEALIFRKLLTGQSEKCAFVYGVIANLASAILGFFLAEPVWRFVASIS